MNFKELNLIDQLNEYIAEKGFKTPSEVQEAVIPRLLDNKSLTVISQTGSGKTLSYALPIVNILKIAEQNDGPYLRKGKPLAAIIAPTKELAAQIHNVLKEISHHARFRARLLTGGMGNEKMRSISISSFDILVATPSKLVSAMKYLSLENLQYLIFDESDTLFEMGFQKDIEKILKKVELAESNVSFFSATLPVSVELFINEKFKEKNLEKISFKSSHKLQQKVDTYNLFVSVKEKLEMTYAFLKQSASGRGIIFANQKNQVDEIAAYLKEKMPTAKFLTVHADQPAAERLQNMKKFTEKKAAFLVASDVVARGIDIEDLKWVFNYNLPRKPEFYLHRCGRVGRMGKQGQVYNLITDFDAKLISLINESIKTQSSLNLDIISSKMKKPANKAVKTKKKSKRVKITKRTKR